jgi:uncharacterized protein YpmB
MTKVLISLIVAVIVIAVCLIVVSLYVYDMAIKRKDPGSNQAIAPADRRDWLARQRRESWQITSEDGLKLVGLP